MEANGRRRVRTGVSSSTRAGSVWESRMKVDEFKGGIKVYNGEVGSDHPSSLPTSPAAGGGGGARRPAARSLTAGTVASGGKRKTWKSESLDGGVQIAGVSVDGVKKNPFQGRKVRSELGIGSDGIVRSPVQISKKGRSSDGDGGGGSSVEVEKARSESESKKELGESGSEIEGKNDSSGSEESCRELVVCEDKIISATAEKIRSDEDEDEDEEDDDEEEEGGESEEEIEKKGIDIKEIDMEKPKEKVVEPTNSPEEKPKKAHQFHNRAPPAAAASTVKKQPPPVMRRASVYQNFTKPSTSAQASSQSNNYPGRQSKLQNLVDLVMWRDVSRSSFVFGIGTFGIISSSYTQDLNISFISVVSYLGLVYLAAIFLYRTLLYRGAVVDEDDDYKGRSYVIGEGEAINLVKLVLPYLNECLLKIKALFSGDPSTTMKLAVLLFVLARCGGYITIWKMAKLGFFGAFILPKVCSSYSTQLTSCAKFWIRRFRDAWEKCEHKKAVALGIFTLVWNLSSVVARVWAVFVMFVAVRYYQQCMVRDGENWADCDGENGDFTTEDDAGEGEFGPRRRPTSGVVNNNSKVKKIY